MAGPRAVTPGPAGPRKQGPAAPPEPTPIDLGEESVAGEEDPGAALDVDAAPAPATPPRKPTVQGEP
jgi:hypothetical protein